MDKDVIPTVSILMPVYNAGAFLREALESVLKQTFTDFELLIFDDASTDNSSSIIHSFEDNRIKSFKSERNLGYVHHLNNGLTLARGKYIARMDADDICHKDRLEKQVAFMEKYPDIGICGTQIEIIDKENNRLPGWSFELSDEALRVKLLSDSCFAHPTVFLRKKIFEENHLLYDETFMPAEDYKLWCDIAPFAKFANLPDSLLKYRVHEVQTSVSNRHLQKQNADRIRKMLVEKLTGSVTEKDFRLHVSLVTGQYTISSEFLHDSKQWLERLTAINRSRKIYSGLIFEREMQRIWFAVCSMSHTLGPSVIVIFFSSTLGWKHIRKIHILKFFFKVFIKWSAFYTV